MSPALAGAVLGALVAAGLLLVVSRVVAMRRTPLALRVLPYVHELPRNARTATTVSAVAGGAATASPTAAAAGVFGPLLRRAADVVEGVLGGAVSVRRRLDRADLDLTVHDFRVEQVLWGLAGFALAAAWQVLGALSGDVNVVTGVVLCLGGFVLGVVLRDRRLSTRATERDREVMAEFPVLAELLALSVASGEGPVAALDRVVQRSRGALSVDLGKVLARIRTGEPVARAFEELARSSEVPIVTQFAQGVAVAIDRGTPLADVLHAQAADVREAGRRGLIESAARREIFMIAPVVFLVLPVTVLFALYPGVVGLRLVAP